MTTIQEILKRHGPSVGLQENPVQIAYAQHIDEGVRCAIDNDGGVVMAEAETGVGKTIGYLVPILLQCAQRNARAIVSTYTIALQRQILSIDPGGSGMLDCDMKKALDIVEAHTGRRLSAALRLGKRNFFDADRVAQVVGRYTKLMNKRGDTEAIAVLESLRLWACEHPGEEIRDYLAASGLDALPFGIQNQDICIAATTRRAGDSYVRYMEHVDRSKNADVVVTNHAMLIANSMVGRNRILHSEDDGRDIAALVVDEADRMPDAARSATSDLLPVLEFKTAANNWRKHAKGVPVGSHVADTLIAALDAMRYMLAGMSEGDEGVEETQFWDQVGASVRKDLLLKMKSTMSAIEAIKGIKPNREMTPAEAEDLRDLHEYCDDFVAIYEIASEAHGQYEQDENNASQRKLSRILALRWSPDRHYPSFRTFRLYPARVLKRMWDAWTMGRGARDTLFGAQVPAARAKALVLTSATLSPPNRFGKLQLDQLNIEFGVFKKDNPCETINQDAGTFAPKKFGSMSIVFSDPSIGPVFIKKGEPHDEDDSAESVQREYNPAWIAYQVTAIKAAMREGGRILVLTNSYRANAAIADALRVAGVVGFIEKTRRISADACENAFVADVNAVLLSPSAWEGFDISRKAGRNAIRHVIITQIPFAQPDGPFQKALKQMLMRDKGFDEDKANGLIYGNIRAAAMRKARQAVGRGIRSASDSFTLWLTDPRFPRSDRMRDEAGIGGVMAKVEFQYIIPYRFRDGAGVDAQTWGQGRMLGADGRIVDARETEGELI